MSYWTSLGDAVQAAVKSGRIGDPVFVRCTAASAEESGHLTDILGELAGQTSRWFSGPAERVLARGGPDEGHLTAALEFPTGASAILSVCRAHGRPEVDIVVLGCRGAVYHRQALVLREGSSAHPHRIGATFLSAVRRSLATGQPVQP
ncbi:MAG: hypothetical protein HYU36_07940 [Planctomycetes bacterium]|nr:hypothetical protein [Planctomycetota bacterium]